MQVTPGERLSLERVWGLTDHLVVYGWWVRNELVSDCWILVRRMRSKKTVKKWVKSRKALGSAESSGLGRGAGCQFLPGH